MHKKRLSANEEVKRSSRGPEDRNVAGVCEMVRDAAIGVYQQVQKKNEASVRTNKRTAWRKLCSQVNEDLFGKLTRFLRKSSEDHSLRIE